MVVRLNNEYATQALLTQMAASSLFSKDAGRQFKKIIERMTNE